MAEYLIQGKTLTEIADAIRERTGLYNSMKPDAMPAYIRNIEGGSGGGTIDGNAPEDIMKEAERVSVIVNSRDISESIKFIAMSDMHELGDGDTTNSSILEVYRRANLNAGQGAKILADNINPDFYVNLGDFAWGGNNTTIKDGVESIKRAIQYISGTNLAYDSFLTPGNHDPLTYSYPQNGTYLNYDFVTGLIGTYTYKDFDKKKIRVIVLNTADTKGLTISYSTGAERISGEQLQWFAETLDMSSKPDAKDWGIIIFSHHPLDWGNILPAANCLQAYLTGSSFSATHNGTSVHYNFSGKNSATVIAQFHGHVHGFKVDYIHHNLEGTMSLTSVNRIAIPNACFARNNEYGENGREDSNGIEFGEADSYEKVDDSTGKNTAFCAISIDLKKKIIYADCFGSGYDRIVTYGEGALMTYSVTNTLRNAVSSNGATVVTANSAYTAVITANSGYKLNTVTVTMGGEDITSEVYSQGLISIPSVTGDIVVTVTAVSTVTYDVTNLVLTSEEQNSTAVYNGIGYKNGVYASESGDGTDAACVSTGWIPYTWDPANVIYVRGAEVSTANHVRFYGWKSKTEIYANGYCNGEKLDMFFTVEELETGTYYKLTPLAAISAINYIRISLIGVGENLIITVNEKIVASGGSSGEDSGSDESGTYTNLVPLSTTDGTTVYNAPYGYTDGKYISTSGTWYGTDAACVATGNIYIDSGVNAIYIKGAAWDTGNSHARFMAGSTAPAKNYLVYADGSGANAFEDLFTMETLGENYYKWTLTKNGKAHLLGKYYRLSLVGTGENLIISHNVPIE